MAHSVAFVSSLGEVYDTITDTFDRTETDEWGDDYTCEGGAAANFDVAAGVGTIALTTTNVTRRAFRNDVDQVDSDATIVFDVPAVATGATYTVGLMPRYIDVSNYLRIDARYQTDGNVILRVMEQVAGSATNITSTSTIDSYTAGSDWNLRVQAQGNRMRAKLWEVGDTEPAAWHAQSVLTSDALAAASGSHGVRCIAETGNTNAGLIISVTSYTIASPTQVRLDLNDGATWRLLDSGTELPPPPLKRAVASTLMLDGARIAAAAYDNRTIRLRLNLTTASENASATALQSLFRELDRPFNILRWLPDGATHPVHFRTFRTSAEAVREVLPSGGLRELEVELAAEPFGYGLKRTLATSTVTNDPASSCYFDVVAADVIGDVETPAILAFAYADVEDNGPTAVAVRRRGTPSLVPFVLQAETMTGGTDTTIQANDAVMSGSSQNYMECDFGTVASTMTTRLTSATWPTAAGEDNRGVYRVFLRCRKSVSGDTINVQLGWSFGVGSGENREVRLPSTTNRRWIDLGTVQIPFAADPVYDGLSGVELPARGGVFTVSAQRTAGSGDLDFDCLVFVPACDRFALVSWPSSTGPTYAVVDGTTETVYHLGGDAGIYPREAGGVAGMFPYLTPNQDQRMFVLLNAGGQISAVSDDITSTVDITTSYYPRYLYVRPAAS